MDGKEAVRRILEAVEVQPSLYRIGQSKVFFRTGVIAGLEEDRDEKLAVLVVRFQAVCRGFLARNDFTRRRERTAAIRIIQRNGLAFIRLRGWSWWRLFTKVKPLLEITNKDMVIAEKEEQLRSTSERLRRSEIHISDMSRELQKFGEERSRLQEKLDVESMERAEADEARERIAAQNMELERALEQMEQQLRTEERHRDAADRDRKKLKENVREITLRLEEEERARQTLHLEKNEIEKKLRDIELRNVEREEIVTRLAKEKRGLEERVKDLSSRLIDEEEKSNRLQKQKSKAEIALDDLQQELEREKFARSECEAAKRIIDGELREERESATDRLQKIEEFSQMISRRDAELIAVKLRYDEETSARQHLEKTVRDLQSRLDDALEDLKQEQSLRTKAEKARRDLSEEIEGYKLELEETQGKTASHHAMRTKREEECSLLQKQLAESMREADERCEALRVKYQKQTEELEVQMDMLKRSKAASDKGRSQLEAELAACKTDVMNMQALLNESEKRRKMAENQLADKSLQLQQCSEEREQLAAKVGKLTSELETVMEGKESQIQTNGNLLKEIAVLNMQIVEMTEASEEAKNIRSNLTAKLCKTEDDVAKLMDDQLELKSALEKSEKEATSLRAQLAESRKRFDEAVSASAEELKRVVAREVAAATSRAEEAEAARDKAQRAKMKAQQEAEDACREVTDITASLRECERRQRKFDQLLAEEKANTLRAMSDLDLAQQQAREAETRFLNAAKELKELREQIEDMEKERRFLRMEVDNLASTKDDTGKSVFELEKAKKRLEEELNEAKSQIVDLEDALQMADDAKSRGEVMLQAAKQDYSKQLAQREQNEEDQRRSMAKRLRDLEEELGAEQRLKSQAITARKKLEGQIQSLHEEVERLSKQNEEAKAHIRRAHLSVKEAETEGAEARAAMDEALCRARDVEKRLRVAETEISRLSGDLSTSQNARRKIEAERDDLVEELSSLRQGVFGQEEKNRYEQRITDLQEMLGEEQSNNELVNDKLRKAQAQVEQLTSDLTMERSVCERTDAEKTALERTIRELKKQLEDAETNTVNRLRTQIAAAEAKSQKLEHQLQAEEQEKARFCRLVGRYEKRIVEMNAQSEEHKRQMEQHRQASERANSRYKSERRRVLELEEELTASNSKCRELSRQLVDANDSNDSLTRDLNSLRARISIASDRRVTWTSRDLRGFESTTSISRGEEFGAGLGQSSNFIGGFDVGERRPSSRTTQAGSTHGLSEDGDSTKA
ncbi:Myosin N-terminal SH3-like domain [Parelaphostrongylus tenuis]|uniref:Myosin N-terminal SH3-like domain n=1 Tax=Parelaphostrongylus tenuis TaxID=148309 RepID=A0AAD5M722_PARTN|nr:Myosin N-terminal SH3-like domain [Parelaphostrongylus tenuis]